MALIFTWLFQHYGAAPGAVSGSVEKTLVFYRVAGGTSGAPQRDVMPEPGCVGVGSRNDCDMLRNSCDAYRQLSC